MRMSAPIPTLQPGQHDQHPMQQQHHVIAGPNAPRDRPLSGQPLITQPLAAPIPIPIPPQPTSQKREALPLPQPLSKADQRQGRPPTSQAQSQSQPPAAALAQFQTHPQSQTQQQAQPQARQASTIASQPAAQDGAPNNARSASNRNEARGPGQAEVQQMPRAESAQQDLGGGGGGHRQLKVEDALAYLEQVKLQFETVPSVYNHFLDIMKEFKAQTIDTAEVIRRVSSLFQGHRDLILGFNTFLPPGYKIELRGDPATAGCVTGFSGPGGNFCTLNGEEVIGRSLPLQSTHASTQPDATNSNLAPPAEMDVSAPLPTVQGAQSSSRRIPQGGRGRRQPNIQNQSGHGESNQDRGEFANGTSAPEERGHRDVRSGHTSTQPGGTTEEFTVKSEPFKVEAVPVGTSSHAPSTGPSHQNENAAVTLAGGLGTSPSVGVVGNGKPIEFDTAVHYVNKIKSRFSENETVYKTFLGILQTYQKEQRSIKHVYDQVSDLFRNHVDLLNEFSHFLPETEPHALAAAREANQSKAMTDGAAVVSEAVPAALPIQAPETEINGLPAESGIPENLAAAAIPRPATPPVAYSAGPSTVTAKGKEKGGKAGVSKGKGAKGAAWTSGPSGGISKVAGNTKQRGGNGEKKNRRGASSKKAAELRAAAGATTADGSSIGAPLAAVHNRPELELEFFEEIRKALGKEGEKNYAEFIKCLSLFSQEIIGGDELKRLADGLLLHRKPLTDAFRAFLDRNDPNATETAVALMRKYNTETENARNASVRAHTGAQQSPAEGVPVGKQQSNVEMGTGDTDAMRDVTSNEAIANSTALDHNGDDDVIMKASDEGRKRSSGGVKENKSNPLYDGKPLSEIGREFGGAVAGSASYAVLPADIGNVEGSGMTASDRSVLNHNVVSKGGGGLKEIVKDESQRRGSGSKRTSSGSRGDNGGNKEGGTGGGGGASAGGAIEAVNSPRGVKSGLSKNYEFGLEDQRMEIDLLISRAENTVGKLRKVERGEIRNISSLNPVDLKPVEMIYPERSMDMLDMLKNNASVVLPIVMSRLKERIADWQVSRKNLESIWKSKRFGLRKDVVIRSWKRSELLEDLICDGGGDDSTVGGSSSSGGGTVRVDESEKCGKRCVEGELVCEDENLNFIIEVLWFGFEWAAGHREDSKSADEGVDLIDRVYMLLQRCEKRKRQIYICEYLYEYMRLVAEASTRVKFIMDKDKQERRLAGEMIENVKTVLNGSIKLTIYDQRCAKLFGTDKGWEEKLGDLTLILKRLSEAATGILKRKSAMELLKAAEEYVVGDGGDGEGGRCRLRKTMDIAERYNVEVLKVGARLLGEQKVRDDKGSKKDVVKERRLGLEFVYIPKHCAGQFERLDVDMASGGDATGGGGDDGAGSGDIEVDQGSVIGRFAERCKRRMRRKGLLDADGKFDERQICIGKLDVRVNDKTGEYCFVAGSWSFFMRAAFLSRGKRRSIAVPYPRLVEAR